MAGLLRKLFGRSEQAEPLALYDAIVAAGRRPVWYRSAGVPDTLDGRFDMIAAVLAIVLIRLEEEGEPGRLPAARLTETFVADMDGQLRQAGVGDIVVGKHVGRMMGALGGRLGALRTALSPGGNIDAFALRNIYRGDAPNPAAGAVLRDGLAALHRALAATPLDAILNGKWLDES